MTAPSHNTTTRMLGRRGFLRLTASASAVFALPALLACGTGSGDGVSGTPAAAPAASTSSASAPMLKASSQEKIKIGFIALTDAASVIMAHELGLFKQYDLNVDVVKQASWASTRDALLTGDIQASHLLFGLPFSVYTGIGGPAGKEIYIAMTLNNNGQAITLANEDFGGGRVGYKAIDKVKAAVDAVKAKKEATFAMTFPGGTHDMWLRYWLAAAGVDQKSVKIITIPPAQMVANMKVGNMDGYCVGEPWGGVAVKEGFGFTHITTQDMWKHHPEKVLGVNADFATKRRDDLKLMMRAILEASTFIDDPKNTAQAAKVIGGSAYVNAPADVIDARLAGKYTLGKDLGDTTFTEDTMLFSNKGMTNFPRHSYAAWFMAQYVRFGYLKELPDTRAIAEKLIMQDLYKEVAKDMNLPIPEDNMAPFTVKLDNATFDPADPAAYLKKYGGIA